MNEVVVATFLYTLNEMLNVLLILTLPLICLKINFFTSFFDAYYKYEYKPMFKKIFQVIVIVFIFSLIQDLFIDISDSILKIETELFDVFEQALLMCVIVGTMVIIYISGYILAKEEKGLKD